MFRPFPAILRREAGSDLDSCLNRRGNSGSESLLRVPDRSASPCDPMELQQLPSPGRSCGLGKPDGVVNAPALIASWPFTNCRRRLRRARSGSNQQRPRLLHLAAFATRARDGTSPQSDSDPGKPPCDNNPAIADSRRHREATQAKNRRPRKDPADGGPPRTLRPRSSRLPASASARAVDSKLPPLSRLSPRRFSASPRRAKIERPPYAPGGQTVVAHRAATRSAPPIPSEQIHGRSQSGFGLVQRKGRHPGPTNSSICRMHGGAQPIQNRSERFDRRYNHTTAVRARNPHPPGCLDKSARSLRPGR